MALLCEAALVCSSVHVAELLLLRGWYVLPESQHHSLYDYERGAVCYGTLLLVFVSAPDAQEMLSCFRILVLACHKHECDVLLGIRNGDEWAFNCRG